MPQSMEHTPDADTTLLGLSFYKQSSLLGLDKSQTLSKFYVLCVR
jgi:hypothetical protein